SFSRTAAGASENEQYAWGNHFTDLNATRLRLEAELATNSAGFHAAMRPVTPAELIASLPPRTVLVDYFFCSRYQKPGPDDRDIPVHYELAAFVVRQHPDPAKQIQLIPLGWQADLESVIEQWRKGFGETPEAREAGQRLRRVIWQPLLPMLQDADTI